MTKLLLSKCSNMNAYIYQGEPMFFHSTKNIEVQIEKDDVFAIVDDTHMRLNSMSVRNYDHKEMEMIKEHSESLGEMTDITFNTMVEKVLNAKHGFTNDEPVYETDATLTNTYDLMLRGVRFKKHTK